MGGELIKQLHTWRMSWILSQFPLCTMKVGHQLSITTCMSTMDTFTRPTTELDCRYLNQQISRTLNLKELPTLMYGLWSNYPYFPSGTIALSGIEQGLFLVDVTSVADPEEAAEEESAFSMDLFSFFLNR